jgi:hypothetical protein
VKTRLFQLVCAAALTILPVLAQSSQDKVIFERHAVAQAGEPNDVIHFIGAPVPFEAAAIKGAPYSADSTSETIQTLANGNRIVRKNTTTIYRDSDGRTRREETMTGVGPWASSGGTKQFINISDPTTNSFYHLDPDTKTARKVMSKAPPPGAVGAQKLAAEKMFVDQQVHLMISPGPGEMMGAAANVQYQRFDSKNAKPEDLGQKMIEGVMAKGTRVTVTIPAGSIGNEQPIETVTERWYSDELKTPILTKTTDPRFGDTTFRLTNIRRAEPAAYLFQVPPDYKVEDMPGPAMQFVSDKPEKK